MGINVLINAWNNDSYTAIQEKRVDAFYGLLGKFTLLAFAFIIMAVYQLYLQQMLQIEWRTWLNERCLADWLQERAYYRLLTERLPEATVVSIDHRDSLAEFDTRRLDWKPAVGAGAAPRLEPA